MFSLHNIKKKFGSKNVLKDISFTIKEGDKIALLGCNGAGKSTLFKIIAGQVKSDSGLIKTQLDFKNDIGMMPQDDLLIKDLTVKELVLLKAYMNKLKDFEVESMLSKVELSDKKKDLVGDLSGGQQRRLSLLLSLLNNPRLLFLDEPTSAMDTSTRQHFWEIVDELKKKGVTIIYSSHYIEEVEHTADRILVLHKGELIRDTTPYAMRSEEQEKHFTIPLSYQTILEGLSEVTEVEIKQNALSFATRKAGQVWQVLVDNGCTIEEVEVRNRTLLDSIFETTQE